MATQKKSSTSRKTSSAGKRKTTSSSSSRSKKETTVIAETELDEAALREAIRATGYDAGEIRKEPWGKKGLFGR